MQPKSSHVRLTQLGSGIADGTAVIEGPTYRFDLVWYAYERLMDALTREYGQGQFLLDGKHIFDWHSESRDKLKEAWEKSSCNVQVCTWCTINLFPEFRARSLLLGNDFCVVSPVTGRYRTARGKPLEEIDAEPKVAFFSQGELKAKTADFPSMPSLPMRITMHIEKLLASEEFRVFGFRFEKGMIALSPGGKLLQDCRVAFPFETYGGSRREYIRVRCYMPNDMLIEPEIDGRN